MCEVCDLINLKGQSSCKCPVGTERNRNKTQDGGGLGICTKMSVDMKE